MGIFSAIGGFLGGPFGAAIGGIGDGIFGASQQRKQVNAQNAMEMNKYVNLRKAAEKGGFHPLAVLNAGGGVNMQAAPRLLTSLSQANAFDALENEISGEGAKARDRQSVRDEIERLERERLKYDVAAATRTRPTIGNFGNIGSENALSVPASVSSLDTKEDGVVVDPHRADAGVITERLGESEIAQELMFLPNVVHDWSHNELVGWIAEKTGKSKSEINEFVYNQFDSTSAFRAWVMDQKNKAAAKKEGTGKHIAEWFGLPRPMIFGVEEGRYK